MKKTLLLVTGFLVTTQIFPNSASAGIFSTIVNIIAKPIEIVVHVIKPPRQEQMISDPQREALKRNAEELTRRANEEEQNRRKMLQASEDARRILEEKKKQQIEAARIEEERQLARLEAERIEAEQKQIMLEIDRIKHELKEVTESQNQLNEQLNGSSQTAETVTIEDMVKGLNDEQNPTLQEYWAVTLLLLDPTQTDATHFLKNIKGWSDEEITEINDRQANNKV